MTERPNAFDLEEGVFTKGELRTLFGRADDRQLPGSAELSRRSSEARCRYFFSPGRVT